MNDNKCSNFGNDEYEVVWWGEYAYKHLAVIHCTCMGDSIKSRRLQGKVKWYEHKVR